MTVTLISWSPWYEKVSTQTGLEVVEACELLPAGVEVHLAAPVEEHVHRPPAKAAASLPQLQRAWLITGNELGEFVRQPLDAK
jgi:hypothetical protein